MSTFESSIGTPQLPIAPGFVGSVLKLLVTGAANLRAQRSVTPDMREDSISQRLDEEMRALHRGSSSDIVNWSMRQVRTASHAPDDTFEVDFSFYANILPRNQDWYFAVEAKRLLGKGNSLAASYVREGVMRFVTGKYSLGHDHAVMLGYVVVPPTESAVMRVKDAMTRRAAITYQKAAFAADGTICSHSHTYVSEHFQHGALESFRLIHLIVELFDPH